MTSFGFTKLVIQGNYWKVYNASLPSFVHIIVTQISLKFIVAIISLHSAFKVVTFSCLLKFGFRIKMHNVLPICRIKHLKIFLNADVRGFYFECWLNLKCKRYDITVVQASLRKCEKNQVECLKRNTMEVCIMCCQYA